MSGPSIVQSTGQATASSGTVSFTLGSSPAAGNVLIAECSWNPAATTRSITTPAGWHLIKTANNGGGQAISTFWRAVQAGDGTAWSFTIATTGGNDYTSGALYEITGASTAAPVNVCGFATYGSATLAFATPAVAPTVTGCLVLACWTVNNAGANNSFSSISSGWTEDYSESTFYHATFSAHKNVNTTDTATAVSATLTTTAADVGAGQILLIAATPPPSPYVVQAAEYPAANTASVAFALSAAPAAGDLLTAFIAYNAGGGARSVTPPSGAWTKTDDTGGSTNDSLAAFTYVAQPGDPATWTFTITTSGGNDYASGELYEITGQAATAPVNQHAAAVHGGGTNPFVTAAVTPSVLSCLALSALTTDGSQTVSGVSAGWLLDNAANGGYHSSYSAHQRLLTTDTATAVSCSFTMGGTDSGSSEILLIAPAAAPPPSPGGLLMASGIV